jgi:hypothetical protein
MNENSSTDQELENTIQRILDAETDNFFELATMLGRDPKQDLAGADLHNCDLSNGDLQGANLRKTDLTNANLSGTNLRNADLTGANLTGTNLTNAQLEGIIVQDTLFGQNQGLSLETEKYLKDRNAIFENLGIEFESSYQYEPSLIGFLKYILWGEKKQVNVYYEPYIDQKFIPRIARIQIGDESEETESPFNSIMIMFSWLLAITFFIILGYILYQALILNSEKANIILYHAFTLILGCFIGALTTYLKMASEQKIE